MKAAQLWDLWSSLPDERKPHRVYFGPMVEELGDAEFHPVIDLYVDESNEEIIIRYGEEAWNDLTDRVEGLTGAEFLAKLQVAMHGREDYWIEASTAGPRTEGEAYMRVDFPIRQAGGYDEWGALFLMH